MLFLVEGLDTLASIIIVAELGFIDGLVELGLCFPVCTLNDVHYKKISEIEISKTLATHLHQWHRL